MERKESGTEMARRQHLLQFLSERVRVELHTGEILEDVVSSFSPGYDFDEEYDVIALKGRFHAIGQDEIKTIEIIPERQVA